MKHLLFIVIFVFCGIMTSVAEVVTKHEIVVDVNRLQGTWYTQGQRPRVTNYTVVSAVDYDDNMKPIGDPKFGLVVHDDNFDYSDETYTIYLGSVDGLLSFINKALDFLLKGEKGMSVKYDEYVLLVLDKKISIRSENERPYHIFKAKELENIKKKVTEYCKKNGYPLK